VKLSASQSYGTSLAIMKSHGVTCYPIQVGTIFRLLLDYYVLFIKHYIILKSDSTQTERI